MYKSEVLFIERVDPFAPVEALDDVTLARLVARSRALLAANRSSPVRVTTGPDGGGRDGMGPGAAPGGRLWVYGRAGRACRRCGTPIATRRHGALPRSTAWCPRCQARGPALEPSAGEPRIRRTGCGPLTRPRAGRMLAAPGAKGGPRWPAGRARSGRDEPGSPIEAPRGRRGDPRAGRRCPEPSPDGRPAAPAGGLLVRPRLRHERRHDPDPGADAVARPRLRGRPHDRPGPGGRRRDRGRRAADDRVDQRLHDLALGTAQAVHHPGHQPRHHLRRRDRDVGRRCSPWPRSWPSSS